MTGVVAIMVGSRAGYILTVTPPEAGGFGAGSNVISDPVTASIAPPVAATYFWVLQSGDARISPTAPTSATTSFAATLDSMETAVATFSVTATVSGSVVATATVPVTLIRTS